MTLASPILAILATGCAIATVMLTRRRKIRFTLSAKILSIAGLLLLTIAAGSPAILRHAAARVVVMADFSESTRGASYRDGKLIRQLAGEYNARVIEFPSTAPADETVFDPPDADAIILLSDGQFDLPDHAPPTYPIIDANLAAAKDASIANLEYRNREIVATVLNTLSDTTLAFSSNPNRPKAAPRGTNAVSDSIPHDLEPITAQLNANDPWPENNALTIAPSPQLNLEKWWVGSPPPEGAWRQKLPGELPTQENLYLLPSVIVLDGVTSDQLSPAQITRLNQYAKDLGGSIVLLNLPRQPAFSPLSDSPPLPQRRWVILCDVSGSMAQSAGNGRRIDKAISAVRSLLPTLPENDRLDIGAFARDLVWWTSGKSVKEASAGDFVPSNVNPSGPTNLEVILRLILSSPAENLPAEILLISDAQTDIRDVDSLIASMKASNTHFNLLQVGEAISNPIAGVVRETSGRSIDASSSVDWAKDLQSLAAGGMPERTIAAPVRLLYREQAFSAISIRESWLKDGGVLHATARVGERTLPAVAEWAYGAGRVVSIGCPQRELAMAIAAQVASPPRDPQIAVTIQTGGKIVIRVDAKGPEGYLNSLSLRAQLGDSNRTNIPQTAPGRYELAMNPPNAPTILTVYRDNAVADRIAVAGRYPGEFARIGLNRENLESLAARSGGRVIDSGTPVGQILKRTPQAIAPAMLIAASLCLAALLVLWRSGRLFL